MATTLHNLGTLYNTDGELAKALETFKEALEIRRPLAKNNPRAYLPDLAIPLASLGDLYLEVQNLNQAERALKQASGIFPEVGVDDPANLLPARRGYTRKAGRTLWKHREAERSV